jgi:hypothetical protein
MFVDEFIYHPAQKSLEKDEEIADGRSFSKAIPAFIHIEQPDEENDLKSHEKSLLTNTIWLFSGLNIKAYGFSLARIHASLYR